MSSGYEWAGSGGMPSEWFDLSESMAKSQHELTGASSGGLPPSVQAAATAFLQAWAGYAQESADMAHDLGVGLQQTSAAYGDADHTVAAGISKLDVRLGPRS